MSRTRTMFNRLKKRFNRKHGFKDAKQRKHFRKYAKKWGMNPDDINSPDDFQDELKNTIPNYFEGPSDPEKEQRFNEVFETNMP